jgi:ubiquinone/menaquinone biosynthesis C-methylase UbiE
VHTERVLQHVADPGAVLAEAWRVLRPGGRAVFAEPDWDTLIVDYPDLSVPRAYTRFVTGKVIRNAAIGRQLPRRAEGAGFTVRKVTPVTAVMRDVAKADRFLGFQRVTDRAVADGYLTAESARQWLHHLTTQPFFASVTLYILTAGAG